MKWVSRITRGLIAAFVLSILLPLLWGIGWLPEPGGPICRITVILFLIVLAALLLMMLFYVVMGFCGSIRRRGLLHTLGRLLLGLFIGVACAALSGWIRGEPISTSLIAMIALPISILLSPENFI